MYEEASAAVIRSMPARSVGPVMNPPPSPADHDRARRLARLSLEAGRGTQKDIIDGTGYSRETVRRLIGQGLELLPGPADETGQGSGTPRAQQLD